MAVDKKRNLMPRIDSNYFENPIMGSYITKNPRQAEALNTTKTEQFYSNN
jgi:hypothetical protein